MIVKILKALADDNRIRILNVIRKRSMCVCELEKVLEMTQSNVSRHLTSLKNAGIIDSEKQAQFVFHKLNEVTLEKYPFLKELIFNELDKDQKYADDLNRLQKMKREGAFCKIES